MRVKPRKQRFQNYIPFESVILLGREIQYETICPVDLDMFLRVSLPKTGPLRFGSENQFPLNFAHEYILVQK